MTTNEIKEKARDYAKINETCFNQDEESAFIAGAAFYKERLLSCGVDGARSFELAYTKSGAGFITLNYNEPSDKNIFVIEAEPALAKIQSQSKEIEVLKAQLSKCKEQRNNIAHWAYDGDKNLMKELMVPLDIQLAALEQK